MTPDGRWNMNLDKKPADPFAEAVRRDRWHVYGTIAFLMFVGITIAYLSKESMAKERQRQADLTELSKWREAKSTCLYMDALNFNENKLEAACYREVLEKGVSLEEAGKTCNWHIDQCDTRTAVESMDRIL